MTLIPILFNINLVWFFFAHHWIFMLWSVVWTVFIMREKYIFIWNIYQIIWKFPGNVHFCLRTKMIVQVEHYLLYGNLNTGEKQLWQWLVPLWSTPHCLSDVIKLLFILKTFQGLEKISVCSSCFFSTCKMRL